jgi:acetolactate synthase-1/3 small subunit
MVEQTPDTSNAVMPTALQSGAILRLRVRNHPGVMSHVCGLFARRGFNVEGILCLPIGDATCSVVVLAVNEYERLEQLIRQLHKLEDVLEVHRAPAARAAFTAVAAWLSS